MPIDFPLASLQLQSTVRDDATLELALAEVPVPSPEPDEIVVRVEAAPINPTDIGLLLGPALPETAQSSGQGRSTRTLATLPAAALASVRGRLRQAMPVGSEAAGRVVAAGASNAAQALLGRQVAVLGSGAFAQFVRVPVERSLLLPEGASAAAGASCFINPLTVLGMVDTLRREGHTALVHTAAASNLGQMLQKVCAADGIPLVNIVRSSEQEALLRAIGAIHVCNSVSPHFQQQLTDALADTGATLAFDAIGGGALAGDILNAMEAALLRKSTQYSRYGTSTHKQVYIYGGLDTGPITLPRRFGMAWGVSGWLVFSFLGRIGPAAADALKARIAAELTTTFASHYAGEISLTEALQPDWLQRYAKRATGAKYLINPDLPLDTVRPAD